MNRQKRYCEALGCASTGLGGELLALNGLQQGTSIVSVNSQQIIHRGKYFGARHARAVRALVPMQNCGPVIKLSDLRYASTTAVP